MTSEELDTWAEAFEAFHARFASLFARREPREQAKKYLRGLLAVGAERKNAWQLAELVGDATPDRTQRLLYAADWNVDEARDRLIAFAIETFGEDEGIGVVDETGFLKKGTHSVGVKRQYTGTAGKVDNAQVGTFLSYCSSRGHLLLDRRLFLPQDWSEDAARRARAKVPETVRFQTKPEQAVEMLRQTWQMGLPMRWVTGDELYGNAPALRRAVEEAGKHYVMAVSSSAPVWLERPPLEQPSIHTGGRPRRKVRLAREAPAARTVSEVVETWPAGCWRRFAAESGEKGPRLYDWAARRVIESRDRLPGPPAWLLVRRSLSDPSELAYYLSNAGGDVSVVELARVASKRFTIEQCFEEAKGQAGLDEYEVRGWPSWYRHITLSMMAHAFLAAIKHKNDEKKGLLTKS